MKKKTEVIKDKTVISDGVSVIPEKVVQAKKNEKLIMTLRIMRKRKSQ